VIEIKLRVASDKSEQGRKCQKKKEAGRKVEEEGGWKRKEGGRVERG
jgi:hypothetical protein